MQPGGRGRLTPYAGASVSAVWLSGGGASGGARPGLEAILGAQLQLEERGPVAFVTELRHGYVRGEPHSTSGRVGVAITL